jgi:CheY-like chemotaxis protein
MEKTNTILIVDDYADDRKLIRRLLEKRQYLVEEAGTWKEALIMIKNKDVDLIILDLKMPEMDGYELLGVIRKDNSDRKIPVIIYSSMPKNKEEVDLHKPDAYVNKYSSPSELLNEVANLLNKKDS